MIPTRMARPGDYLRSAGGWVRVLAVHLERDAAGNVTGAQVELTPGAPLDDRGLKGSGRTPGPGRPVMGGG